jgi:hypothetical protein
MLSDTHLTRSKSFLRSFMNRIVIGGNKEFHPLITSVVEFEAGGAEGISLKSATSITLSTSRGKRTPYLPDVIGTLSHFLFLILVFWNLFVICYLVIGIYLVLSV